MTTTMTALNSSSIRQAEFIRLTMPSNTYTFCNAAAPITVSGILFTNLGSLLQISDIKRDVKATSSDLSISLTGVDGTNVSIVLNSDIKGSRIEVWRGFLDSNNQIIQTPTQQFFKRYQGIVSNYSITEDFNEQLRTRIATVGLSCASFRTILENRVGGVRTTPKIWQVYYPADTSMNRVPAIAGSYFDFGGQPNSSGSQAASNAPSQRIFGR
jgi:hypothetical protein